MRRHWARPGVGGNCTLLHTGIGGRRVKFLSTGQEGGTRTQVCPMQSGSERHFGAAPSDPRHYQALLQMANTLVHHRGLREVFRALAEGLESATGSEFVNFCLQDPSHNAMKRYLFRGGELVRLPDVAVEGSPVGWVWQNQQPLVIPDLASDTSYPQALPLLRDQGVRSYCVLPLTTGQRRLGALALGRMRVDLYCGRGHPTAIASGRAYGACGGECAHG